jgi:hypothetical protein
LARDCDSGHVFIVHEPNVPSGGRASHIEIGAFLAAGGRGPEHQELLRLIGTLVDEAAHADEREATQTEAVRSRS